MTREEMSALTPGDIVRLAGDARAFVVTANFGGRVTAVASVDITNPAEWEVARRQEPGKPATPPDKDEVTEQMRLDQLTKAEFQLLALGILHLTGLELYQHGYYFTLELNGALLRRLGCLTTAGQVVSLAKRYATDPL